MVLNIKGPGARQFSCLQTRFCLFPYGLFVTLQLLQRLLASVGNSNVFMGSNTCSLKLLPESVSITVYKQKLAWKLAVCCWSLRNFKLTCNVHSSSCPSQNQGNTFADTSRGSCHNAYLPRQRWKLRRCHVDLLHHKRHVRQGVIEILFDSIIMATILFKRNKLSKSEY